LGDDGSAAQLGPHQRRVERPAQVKALPVTAAKTPQRGQLRSVLDTLRDDPQTENLRELHDGPYQGQILRGQLRPRDERPVDLQLVDR
jgi:hypothetical protein